MMDNKKPINIQNIAPPQLNDDATRHEYRVAYRKAADALVLRVLHERLPEVERAGMIYPIMFLYRHSIEVTLKDLLCLSYMAEITQKENKIGHDLASIWMEILSIVELVQGPKMRSETEESFGPLVLTVHNMDPKGDAFRYPLNTRGQPHWPKPFDVDIVLVKIWIKAFEAWCREIEIDLRKRIS